MKKIIAIMYDKTTYKLTPEQYEAVAKAKETGLPKFTKIDGKLVTISSISHFLDESEYNRQFPTKKPTKEPFFKNYSDVKEVKTTYSDERHKTRLEKMRNGFLIGARVKTKEELSDKQRAVYNTIEAGLIKLTK